MKLALSTIINRPPAVVFDFVAVNHVHNHPRWDPHMDLKQVTAGPLGVGTHIQRRQTRTSTPIEGTMEVIEFEPERVFGAVIVDQTPSGPLEIRSRATMEPLDGGSTKLTFHLDIPAMEASPDPSMIEGSLRRIKELIETET
jgi:hypothetical protein